MSDDRGDFLFDWCTVVNAAGVRRPNDGGRAVPRGRPANPGLARKCAKVIVFPAQRSIGEIRRLVDQMLALSNEEGEAHLKKRLRRSAEGLRLRGIAEQQIESHLIQVELAVRGEIWRRELPTPEAGS